MKNKKIKYFDLIQMTRDIRDAMYKQLTDPNFDPKEFSKLKEKWTKLLKLQEKADVKDSNLA